MKKMSPRTSCAGLFLGRILAANQFLPPVPTFLSTLSQLPSDAWSQLGKAFIKSVLELCARNELFFAGRQPNPFDVIVHPSLLKQLQDAFGEPDPTLEESAPSQLLDLAFQVPLYAQQFRRQKFLAGTSVAI